MKKEIKGLQIRQADDWHLHLRDTKLLQCVIRHSARQFARAIVMPNLKQPITSLALAEAYRSRILKAAAIAGYSNFEPLMTLYMQDNMPQKELLRAKQSHFIHAVKLYPAGVTTNSSFGVQSIEKLYPLFAYMEEIELILLVHAEHSSPEVDIFDREAKFIEDHLMPIVETFPKLRVVVEHISTKEAVDFVSEASNHIAATITAHHMLLERNALFEGGIRPHHYCQPVLQRETDRQALIQAACSGHPKFFLGTDSAPHNRASKETACGCAGIYTAHRALEFYAEIFEDADALAHLEAFSSLNGARFYGLEVNTNYGTLHKVEGDAFAIPQSYFGDELGGTDQAIIPLRAGTSTRWRWSYPVENTPGSPA